MVQFLKSGRFFGLAILMLSVFGARAAEKLTEFRPGEIWPDDKGEHINAHGGGVVYYNGTYYWYGEHKTPRSNNALNGVTCYSSKDLYNWKNEGIALSVDTVNQASDIVRGCIIERPKVVYNAKTNKFVMWFHLELRGKGYEAARAGMAVSDKPTGPFTYVKSYRPNAGIWPVGFPEENKKSTPGEDTLTWWTPRWQRAIENGLLTRRDFKGGQMSRDMTVFVDDDGKAYHLFSSEENLTIIIAELSDDYQSHTGKYIRLAPAGHNEAPAIFKKEGVYYLITSGCTGWEPNAARSFKATSIWGPWTPTGNPWQGEKANISYDSQSTFIFKVEGKKDLFIFMADRWRPRKPSDGRYLWMPVEFKGDKPVLNWRDSWKLNQF